MAFWNGYRLDDFVFKDIKVTSPEGLVGLCAVTVAIAFIFEAMRTFRDWTYLEFLKQRNCHGAGKESPITLGDVSSPSAPPHENGNGVVVVASSKISSEEQESSSNSNGSISTATTTATNIASPSSRSPSLPRAPVMATGTLSKKNCKSKPNFHVGLVHLSISTLLHMCHVILGYILMLVVMTFNVWIFLAVIIGATLGYFLFDGFNRKIHSLKFNASEKSVNGGSKMK